VSNQPSLSLFVTDICSGGGQILKDGERVLAGDQDKDPSSRPFMYAEAFKANKEENIPVGVIFGMFLLAIDILSLELIATQRHNTPRLTFKQVNSISSVPQSCRIATTFSITFM
jgi:hypothetical protein